MGLVGDRLHCLSVASLLITGGTGFIGSYLLETVAFLNDSTLEQTCRLSLITRNPEKAAVRLSHLARRSEYIVYQVPYSMRGFW